MQRGQALAQIAYQSQNAGTMEKKKKRLWMSPFKRSANNFLFSQQRSGIFMVNRGLIECLPEGHGEP